MLQVYPNDCGDGCYLNSLPPLICELATSASTDAFLPNVLKRVMWNAHNLWRLSNNVVSCVANFAFRRLYVCLSAVMSRDRASSEVYLSEMRTGIPNVMRGQDTRATIVLSRRPPTTTAWGLPPRNPWPASSFLCNARNTAHG